MNRRALALAVLLATSPGCAVLRGAKTGPREEVQFDPITIQGDLELEKLNDEELFAKGSSFFAAAEFGQAARYFDRLSDFYPHSVHRRPALYNAGLSHEKLKDWESARARFAELADAGKGVGDALDAAFRLAETLYHLEHFDEAAAMLETIGSRSDLGIDKQIEALVQKGVCELESGKSEQAEATLRKVMSTYQELANKDRVDDYFPAQGQFFLGEIYRLHYESISLDPDKGSDQLAKDLEYKAQLLLSAQGHYLRAIRIGNGHWATAAGAQIGMLYESFYDQMVHSPAPKELNPEEIDVYRQELRQKIRVLLTKAITIYERTLETAERIGASNTFVDRTRESLKKMKDLLIADAQVDDDAPAPPAPGKPVRRGGADQPVPHS